jgi:multidrug efflux pump subunit AcrA (membrane-fusion protein)
MHDISLTPIIDPDSRVPSPPPPLRTRHARRWRNSRLLLAALGLLILAGLVVARVTLPAAPAPSAPAITTPLIAHGQVVPVRQARVGTQSGGIVQQLTVGVGAPVGAQTPLAWVTGPTTTEVVTAPFSGTVTNVFVHQGDTLAPGAALAVVADLHTLQVETNDVDEFLIGHVSVGQAVQVSVDAADNATLRGSVSSVALLPEAAAGATQAYPVTIKLDALPSDVRAGMSVRVVFPD